MHIVRMVREFVTVCFCEFVRGKGREARGRLGGVLEELRDGEMLMPQFVSSICYEDLVKTI